MTMSSSSGIVSQNLTRESLLPISLKEGLNTQMMLKMRIPPNMSAIFAFHLNINLSPNIIQSRNLVPIFCCKSIPLIVGIDTELKDTVSCSYHSKMATTSWKSKHGDLVHPLILKSILSSLAVLSEFPNLKNW